MKVIKNINNNVSICLDANNHEVVVFGKGIGFTKPPNEVSLSMVQRTFYDIDMGYVDMINLIPEDVFEISAQTVNYARSKLDYLFNSNIVFTLADHINFAIKRFKDGLKINMPVYYDMQHIFNKEYAVGKFALKLIEDKLHIALTKDEIVSIGLHIVNSAALESKIIDSTSNEDLINKITEIIENYFEMTIDRDNFSYSRFVSHLRYLLMRGEKGEKLSTENTGIYESVKEMFPSVYQCAESINHFLLDEFGYTFGEEELLYLMLHINRLCVREDCYL